MEIYGGDKHCAGRQGLRFTNLKCFPRNLYVHHFARPMTAFAEALADETVLQQVVAKLAFARAWPDDSIVRQVAAQLSWRHNDTYLIPQIRGRNASGALVRPSKTAGATTSLELGIKWVKTGL